MKYKLVDLVIVAVAFLSLGFILGAIFVDREVVREVPIEVPVIEYREVIGYDYRISDESVMSAYEARLFIDNVIYPHQYYIDRPELQNEQTGSNARNRAIIKQYERLKNLIEKIEND